MSLVTPLRWSGRIFSSLIVLFVGFFLIAHLIGDQGRSSRALVWNDYVILATIVVSLVGLLLAWKWQFAGAAITLIAFIICAAINWMVLISPVVLIPITAVIYLLSWWMSRSTELPHTARP